MNNEELAEQLRHYASHPGYSHNDYADTMREAADRLHAPTASDAGTISEDREFRRLLAREQGWTDNKPVITTFTKEFIAHIDKHLAAAVKAEGERFKAKLGQFADDAFRAEQRARAAEADLAKLRSTAGVGEGISDDIRDLIEGMVVSVDVSTGDDDAGHRYFGKVDAVQDDINGKGGVILLVQSPEPNFAATAPVSAAPTAGDDFEKAFQLIYEAYGRPAMDFPDSHVAWTYCHDKVTEAFSIMQRLRATLLPSAGAPVPADVVNLIVRDIAELDYSSDTVLDRLEVSEADLRAIIERHAGAPVSGAGQVDTWQRAHSGPVPTAQPIGTAKLEDVSIVPLAAPADGQELPVLPIKTWRQRAEDGTDEALTADQCLRLAEREIDDLRAELAMRQPHGDALPWELTNQQIDEVWTELGGMDAWLGTFGYQQFADALFAKMTVREEEAPVVDAYEELSAMLEEESRVAIAKSIARHKARVAAKQAGKEPS